MVAISEIYWKSLALMAPQGSSVTRTVRYGTETGSYSDRQTTVHMVRIHTYYYYCTQHALHEHADGGGAA